MRRAGAGAGREPGAGRRLGAVACMWWWRCHLALSPRFRRPHVGALAGYDRERPSGQRFPGAHGLNGPPPRAACFTWSAGARRCRRRARRRSRAVSGRRRRCRSGTPRNANPPGSAAPAARRAGAPLAERSLATVRRLLAAAPSGAVTHGAARRAAAALGAARRDGVVSGARGGCSSACVAPIVPPGDDRDRRDARGELRGRAAAGEQRDGAFAYAAGRPCADASAAAARCSVSLRRSSLASQPRCPRARGSAAARRPGPGSCAAAAGRSSCARRGSSRNPRGARRRAGRAPGSRPPRPAAPGSCASGSRTAGRCRRAAGSARACVRRRGRLCAPR